MVNTIDAAALKARIHQGGELALIDVREHGQYGEAHLFFAVSIPYSRMELELPRLVPRQSTPIVLIDQEPCTIAKRALARMTSLGYRELAILEGGVEAWQAAGYQLFAGVNLPSKTFGELAEEVFHTPRLSAGELQAKREAGESIAILDGRPFTEHQKMHIPGAQCCPNGELALRVFDIVPDPKTTIIVHCAGRTRSIIGAQTLINLGLPNPIYALENGTQGWALAGLELSRGAEDPFVALPLPHAPAEHYSAAKTWSDRLGIETISWDVFQRMWRDSNRNTMLCDVRTAEEFEVWHLPGAQHTPGGQLIQATDQYIGVRGARLVLYDSENLRARVVACWMHLMGWEVYCLDASELHSMGEQTLCEASQAERRQQILAKGTDPFETIDSAVLANRLSLAPSEAPLVIDLRPSMSFRRARLEVAIWSIRPRLPELLEGLQQAVHELILLAESLEVARLAALECKAFFEASAVKDAESGSGIRLPSLLLCVDTPSQWEACGLIVKPSPDTPTDEACIDYLFFTHDRHDGNLNAARQYLAWELGLTRQIDAEERASFRL